MLLVEISQMMEMARPAKICPDCKKSMAGNHYWYKGGWKCKKSSLADKKEDDKKEASSEEKSEEKKSTQKSAPANNNSDDNKKEHTGAVKGLEREAGEEQDPDVKAAERAAKKAKAKKVGDTISPSEMREISADTEEEARAYINSTFPKASAESKARAMNYWKRTNSAHA